MINSGL